MVDIRLRVTPASHRPIIYESGDPQSALNSDEICSDFWSDRFELTNYNDPRYVRRRAMGRRLYVGCGQKELKYENASVFGCPTGNATVFYLFALVSLRRLINRKIRYKNHTSRYNGVCK